MAPVADLNGPCGLWIFGLAGAGKSRSVRQQVPDYFPKNKSIWWDGYRDQPVIVIDDIDKFHVKLGAYLKEWADSYAFVAEIKGASRQIRPQRIIVTSQYTIEQIWDDQETREALLRRFVVVEKILGQNIII
jgi:hypothetical protein